MAFLVIGIVCICCWIGKEQMLRCIISDTNIIQQAKKLLIFLFAIQLIKVPYQIYMSYLQGIGYEKLVFIVLQPERLQQVLECLYAVHYGNYQGYMR